MSLSHRNFRVYNFVDLVRHLTATILEDAANRILRDGVAIA
jgi:hypothetical protein